MKTIVHVVQDEAGLHARPAGMLVKETQKIKSSVNIIKDGKKVNAKSILGIMSTVIKHGEELVLEIEGEDEDQAESDLKTFLAANL
ncbi:MAG: HPr family phosphocarrier protein [Eubacteriaceae bacterium]